ncbi:hypothetical protein [Streptomyces sp. NPDC091027]|uniref:hypothetical protein n=1 Tax=Streptomyces sp. NPDC091027 TaxID=3365971 RepID=UPI0038140C95
MATVGTCMALGAGIALAKFGGDWIATGEADVNALAKDMAWVAVGGGTAAAAGRAFGGASTWSQAYTAKPIVRGLSVRVAQPANSTRHAVMHQTTRIKWGESYANMSVNAGFNTMFCGSGNSSIGSYGGAC